LILSEEAANVIAERLLVIGDVISNARLLQRRAEQVSEAVAAAR
jgi:orotate phosphoribosyltransferase-like protein